MSVYIWIIGWTIWTYFAASNATVYEVERVSVDESSIPTDASILKQWSSWTEWSSCSRTCGGGTRSQTRTCSHIVLSMSKEITIPTNRSRTHCVGETRRTQICNDQVCPKQKDFRNIQCEQYNKRPFVGVHYIWEAFYDEKNPCALNCRPLGYHFYATLKGSVIDGTTCTLPLSERGVCVDGICQYVGCDGIVNGLRYDVCGVCGGDNSTCRLVFGLFTRPFLRLGYNYITDIPEQACNLNISSVKETPNSFALRFKNGTYLIDGDQIPVGGISTTHAVGTVFTYSRTESQSLVSPGPTSQPLELFLSYRQMNTGLKYEYRMPLKPTSTKRDKILSRHAKHAVDLRKHNNPEIYDDQRGPATTIGMLPSLNFQYRIKDEELKPQLNDSTKLINTFKWMITSFSPCSQTCGEGTKIGIYSCVKENEESHVVADQKCINQAMKRPDSPIIACSLSACSAEWTIGEWGPCSVTCSEGVERRDLQCIRQISERQKLQVDESECAGSPPWNILRTRACFKKPCDNGTSVVQPYWSTGTWSMCSVRCGIGTKTRVVKCVAESEDECLGTNRPPAETSCDMGPCSSQSPAHWLTTEWSSQCTEKCGSGIQTRKVACSADKEEKCLGDPKPESTRQCFSADQCEPRWFASAWSSCSVECGWGKQSRLLVCIAYDASIKSYLIVTDNNCTEKNLPVEQACFTKPCHPKWYFSEWSSCSMSCDSGIQTRRVRCLDENYSSNLNCREEDKPWTKQVCNTEKCPERNKSIEKGSAELSTLGHSTYNPDCTNNINNCHLVLQTRLCNYKYYKQRCCLACSSGVVKQQ